jgi:glycosyltransferase involved in cell wall biosynthesis
MVRQEGLIVRCHSPSIEEDRHGREVEEASCAQPRFPGNRGEGADAQLEGEEAEEDVAREVARSGLRPTKGGGRHVHARPDAARPPSSATTATIDTGTAVASDVVLATTAGTSSLDRCACELAARLDVRAVEIDGYVRTGDLFGVPLLSRRSLQLLVADLDHVRLLRGASGRLVHFPHHHLARYGRFLSRPYVVTVHDLIRFFDLTRLDVFIHRPNLRDRLLLRLDYAGVAGATALIAVSETTKRDVVRHLGVPEERIFVVHEGIDHARFRPVERRLLNERYVLFVGSEHPRKNLAAVLRAFALLRRERRLSDLKLVKVGGPGGSEAPFRARTLALVRALGLDDDVVFTEHVPEEDLSAWYSGAACLAWPSLYEGFGFPPLEAMACGCPVVVSTAGSLPEIAGPAALLVEPRDERALADAIRTLILDPPSDLIERGLAHAARFSWDRTARETLCVYETLLERGSCLDPDPPPDRSPSLYRMRSARPSGLAS